MAYILSKAPALFRTVNKNTIFGATTKITSMRNHRYEILRTNLKAEERFKLIDNISNNYKLVYREHRAVVITAAAGYIVGWITPLCAAICIGYIFIKNPPIEEEEKERSMTMLKPLGKIGRIVLILSALIVSVMVTAVSKAMPLRIYHNPKEKLFKAVFAKNILGKKEVFTFAEGTATPRFTRIKLMTSTLFDINGHTVILDKESFAIPHIHELILHSIK